ncbi:MAG: D-alanyl-D-alanine carboxypeptidase family protein [Pseudomonadota bacterium]
MSRASFVLKTVVSAAAWLTASALFASPADAEERYASYVMNATTDEVLHARFADDERYPASLTKVMTLYMLFDALKAGTLTLSERLPVSRAADRMPASDLGVAAGTTISVEDAIYALVTKSANDVAVVVAERIGGTEDRFAALMTVKARQLGLENTRFYNSSGLPDSRQITTARDMATLAEAILDDHGDYYHYFSNERFTWGRKTYKNHNTLLEDVNGVDGIKTGYTRASGFNLMASATRDGQRIIAIMLGGNSARARNAHVEDLIEAAYMTLETRPSDRPALRTRIAFTDVNEPPLAISGISAGIAEGDTEGVEGAAEAALIE